MGLLTMGLGGTEGYNNINFKINVPKIKLIASKQTKKVGYKVPKIKFTTRRRYEDAN